MRRDRISPYASSFRPTLEELEPRWVPANVGSPNQNFIDQIYRDVLHRAPDTGSTGWVVALDSGTDRGEVVDHILNTDEGLRNQVNDLYVRFLGRPADTGGLNAWVNYLRDGNSNLELAAQLIASQEYYQNAGGTDAGFLNAVYRDVLGRSIDLQEIDDRGDDFDDGFDDRVDIAESILQSSEAQDTRDRLSVMSFLRPTVAVSGEQASDFVDDDDNGGGDFDNDAAVFSGTILSGDVYFARAQTRSTSDDFATIPSSGNLTPQPLQ
jgi:hypothetical protein